MEFATVVARTCSPDTAAAYVSHVQTWHEIYRGCRLGPPTPFALRRAIRGLRKMGKHRMKRSKRPILLEHLEKWTELMNPRAADDRMLKAASDTGFQ